MEASDWLLEARTREGEKQEAQRWLASDGPPEAHLAARLWASQWGRGGWPPWGGWLGSPLEGRWCYICRVVGKYVHACSDRLALIKPGDF